MKQILLTTKPQSEYALLDTGGEEKLEKYGSFILARPDPQALWHKKLPGLEWNKADARYVRSAGGNGSQQGRKGEWHIARSLPKEWAIQFGGFTFNIKATSFKHTGLFPEQLSNWEWVRKLLLQRGGEPKVLNLFAYTGGATLAAAGAGAHVTHVDASKTAVAWARDNATLSGLENKPVRWIVEDVMVFVKREIKRGSKYDAIIMDPPAFGHGPKDELWKIEEDFVSLMELCAELLSDTPLFFLISGYAAGYSPLAFAYNLERLQQKFGGTVECGDLGIEDRGGRVLPCGIVGRWSS